MIVPKTYLLCLVPIFLPPHALLPRSLSLPPELESDDLFEALISLALTIK